MAAVIENTQFAKLL